MALKSPPGYPDMFDMDTKAVETIRIINQVNSSATKFGHLVALDSFDPLEAKHHSPEEQQKIMHARVQRILQQSRRDENRPA